MLILRCAASNFLIAFLFFFCSSVGADEFAVFKIIVNSEDKGEFFLILGEDGELWVSREDIAKMRLKPGLGKSREMQGGQYIALGSMPGLKYAMNITEAVLNIEAAGNLFAPQSIDVSIARKAGVAERTINSAFLNYALFAEESDGEQGLNLATELGGRAADYFFASTFNYADTESSRRVVRNMSWLRSDNRETLRTVIVGDHLALAGGVQPASVLLGGFSLSKNFSLSPYYSTAPALNLEGVINSPSDVDVYVDGYRVSRERLAPGEFTLTNIPSKTGYGQAQVVIRDAYGREEIISENFYIAQQLLKAGLNEYSHNIGFIRENLGDKSLSYGSPALISSFRRGYTDLHTLGYNLNAKDGHVDLGSTAALRLANVGVLGIGAGWSHHGGKSGVGGAIDYVFNSRGFNTAWSLKTYSGDYSTLMMSSNRARPRLQLDGLIGLAARAYGSLSFKYGLERSYEEADVTAYGLFYNKSLRRGLHLFISVNRYKTDGQDAERDFFLGLNLNLDHNVSGNVGFTKTDGEYSRELSVQRSVESGRGAGFLAELRDNGSTANWRGEASYYADAGIYDARFFEGGNYLLSASGGLGYIDGSMFFNRPFTDSFAKVDVGGLPGVKIYYFGNEVARTNSAGEAVLPRLASFHDNKIEIEEADIPIDYNIPMLTAYVNPPYRSGTLIDFGVSRVYGIYGKLISGQKEDSVPVEYGELRVHRDGHAYLGMVGRDGEFYIENLPPGSYDAEVDYLGGRCMTRLFVPVSDDVLVNVGEIRCLLD